MIKEVIITGFRGTFLANISNLHFRFGSPIQIIAGTNGCGKTRLMNEFHLLPPDPKDYQPGGGKVIFYEPPSGKYRLSSHLKKKAFEHSFVQIQPDGSELELNPGGTTVVQRELVKRYFGLTPLIQSVLSGKLNVNRLSGMPPLRRKELFTELCPVDLTYALNTYQQLKTQANHTLGARKTAEKRLAGISAQLIDQNEIVELQKDSEQLRMELDVLMRNYQHGYSQDRSVTERRLAQTEQTLYQKSKALLELKQLFNGKETPELIERAVQELEQAIAVNENERQTKESHFVELNTALLEITERQGLSKETIDSRLMDLKRAMSRFTDDVKQSDIPECGIAIEQLDAAKQYLVECLQSMPNPGLKQMDFSQAAAQTRRANREVLGGEISKRKKQLEYLADELQHIRHLDDTECPKCATKFKPGFRPERPAEIEQQLGLVQAELDRLLALMSSADADEQLQLAFEEGLQRLRRATTEFPRLSGLWNKFAEIPFHQTNTVNLVREISLFDEFLHRLYSYRELEREYKQLQEMRSRIQAVGEEPTELIVAQAKALELDIERLTARSRTLKTQHGSLVTKLTQIRNFIRESEEIKNLNTARLGLYKERLELERNAMIEALIESHQQRLALLTHRLHEVTVNQALVKDLEQQIEELKQDEIHYGQLLDALSPTDGLIAEQLSGFIAEFVGKMNEIISKFWTYDIRVFPCGIENADLNYRFPVEILSEENQAPDVSEVSWGQKDLIDTAFKLVIALYLQRPEWPIYLDELGATFDETHHRKVLQFIKDYVDSGKASMAFIVSHYASSHTAMSDAELTILDTSNVTVLKDHNKHVVLS